jgi:hypothetical protein
MDALRCVCGWGAKKPDRGGKSYDMRCGYKATSGDRCDYPVGMFPEGKTSGWCIFHRQQGHPGDGAEIVRQSKQIPYREAIQQILDRNASAPSVVDLAWEIAKRHGNKPWQGELSAFAREVIKSRAA